LYVMPGDEVIGDATLERIEVDHYAAMMPDDRQSVSARR
jgi:hypothetical protein